MKTEIFSGCLTANQANDSVSACGKAGFSSFVAYFRLLFIIAAFVAVSSCSGRDNYVSITGFAQGGTYVVKINLAGSEGKVSMPAGAIKAGIDSVLLEIDNSLSGYNKGSLLSKFNAGEAVVPDRIFQDIYNKSYDFYLMTGGAFDVASAPLFDIWGFGFTSDSLPSESKVAEVLSYSGMDRLVKHMEKDVDGTVSGYGMLLENEKEGELPRLNYNAVAQGYSCDIVASYLASLGIKDMLIDIGGEIFCQGLNPSGLPWSVGVDKPVDGNDTPGEHLQGVLVAGPEPCGIVTSGNYRKFYVKDGKKYAHTIDPRKGYPVSHSLLSATVVAADATVADALATYCMVIGLEKAKEFILSRPDIEGYLIYDNGGVLETWASSGFRLSED